MGYKETTLVTSDSPQNINKIEIVEKGETTRLGSTASPTSVRIYYGTNYEQRRVVLANIDKTLRPSNFSIVWKDNYEATVILNGEEQVETVEIYFKK